LRSSISSSDRIDNRRFAVAAACAFLAFFGVDWLLFANEGFLRAFGQATQEGQIVSKVQRAGRMAESADIILFGSSYVRSGVSGEPFLDHGLLPFNFAVSGGGPVFDYFALRRIAPILLRRAAKPVLLLELKTDTLRRLANSAWSEYPQYIAIVRSRREMLAHARLLWTNFADFNLTSQFISGVVLPSSIYRSEAVPILGTGATLDGYFYGAEDFSGFSPLVTVARPSMIPAGRPPPPLAASEFLPGKVSFLREFLKVARATGCRVVLYQSPTVLLGRDSLMLDGLIAALQSEFPGLGAMRTDGYPLTIGDFDEGGHPNLLGSDKMARHIIAALGLSGDRARVVEKQQAVFDAAPIPRPATWTFDPTRAGADGGTLIVRAVTERIVAESPPIPVSTGRDWVFEAAVSELQGRLTFVLSWFDAKAGAEQSQLAVTPDLGPSSRVVMRLRPNADRVTLRITDYSLAAGGPPSTGRLTVLRLWANR
jgi:hypothetical protein